MTLETRFRTLSRLAAECQRHIDRLEKVDSITIQQEVAALIRDDIRRFEADVQAIKQLADEAERESSKLQILGRLGEYETQLQSLRISSRQAIVQSKQRVDQQEKKNREELFGLGNHTNGESFTERYELKQRGLRGSADETILRASSDVTEALKRTSTLMQQELEKSAYSATMLADSSKTLAGTYAEYQNFGSLMTISRRLISQLENSDLLDRILLLVGVVIFCLVVLYIVKKRTWDVGISWMSWLAGGIGKTGIVKEEL
ncbi:hypothetical protein EC973_002565 [Apophysomyces ossiformis]|uniref:Protein transport protein BOS1 n=1 Tax=Apophysomyces ossiformis TaxID=679940 RepID=A0A8H7BI70_9FUNG|nr:hypothetical protein EC973_002565 [Apophysomyces ossiformis]